MATYETTFVHTYHHTTYASISERDQSLCCKEKVVFITGGGRGIGRAIARSFAVARARGIFLIGRTKSDLQGTTDEIAKLNETCNGNTIVHYAEADVTDVRAVAAAFRQAIDAFGQINVLIQNAGYLDAHRSIIDSDLEDYWKSFEVNVRGGIIVIQEFLKVGPKAGDTIINIGSGAGHIPYIPGYSAYSASKLSLAKIVEYVQHENPHLRVFNINPGAIATEMQVRAGDLAATDEIGLPGSFCVWLTSSADANAFKGRFLWANWDVDELKQRVDEIQTKNLLIHGLKGM